MGVQVTRNFIEFRLLRINIYKTIIFQFIVDIYFCSLLGRFWVTILSVRWYMTTTVTVLFQHVLEQNVTAVATGIFS